VPLQDRLAAAGAAGWDGFSLGLADLRAVLETASISEVRGMLDAHGIDLIQLELLSGWWADGAAGARADADRSLLLDAAAALDATVIKVAADTLGPDIGEPRHVRELDRLAAEAGSRGIPVALEPTAISNLSDLAAAVGFIRAVDNPFAGLCLDLWHLRRSGTTNEQLAALLSISDVLVVELADGAGGVVGSLAEDNLERRLPPGEGALDAPGFVATMHDLGWRGPWGVEIMADAHRRLTVPAALRIARAATMLCLDEADQRPSLRTRPEGGPNR